jgi:hypothetical protein
MTAIVGGSMNADTTFGIKHPPAKRALAMTGAQCP